MYQRTLAIVLTVLCIATSYCQNDSISFLALGDSYTIGTAESLKNNWPNQLTAMLSKKYRPTKVKILANAGWTTEKLLFEIEQAHLKSNFDLVSLLIGVNNQYRGMKFESFKKDFGALLEKSIELAKNDSTNVFVLSIPDWSATPFARFKDKIKIEKELKAYNSFIKKETKKRGILFINITQISKKCPGQSIIDCCR